MKIIVVEKNYGIKGQDSVPEISLKPDSALLKNNKPFFIPDFSNGIVANVYPTIRINRLGKHIAPRFAPRYYSEIGLGVSLTATDLLDQQRAKGNFSELARTFDGSAVISDFKEKDYVEDFRKLDFALKIDNKEIQQGSFKDLIYNVDEIIAYISRYLTLKIGDIIFVGTPVTEGTKIKIGDCLKGYLGDDNLINFNIK